MLQVISASAGRRALVVAERPASPSFSVGRAQATLRRPGQPYFPRTLGCAMPMPGTVQPLCLQLRPRAPGTKTL